MVGRLYCPQINKWLNVAQRDEAVVGDRKMKPQTFALDRTAVDLTSGALLALTLQPANEGDMRVEALDPTRPLYQALI